jgi:hypothetical protein
MKKIPKLEMLKIGVLFQFAKLFFQPLPFFGFLLLHLSMMAENIETVRVSGSYRKIAAVVREALELRKGSSFLVVEHQDGTGKIVRYAGFTDISNFLHELETVLIPKEDIENSIDSYGPIKLFGGCRF